MSYVSQVAAAPAQEVIDYFSKKLALETDCADVASTMKSNDADFVLLHVVGSSDAFAKRHVPGAIHLPHRDISEERMSTWPKGTLFVVYCAGPHCNGADQAALKLARLGRQVKVMIGGVTGWADEGLPFETGAASGDLRLAG